VEVIVAFTTTTAIQNRTRTSNGNTAKPASFLDFKNVPNRVTRGQHNWVCDESVFVTFHATDHLRLTLGRLVVMNNANAAKELKTKKKLIE
jgi:hypothetical protein